MSNLGLPTSGGSAPHVSSRLSNQGLFSVPTGIQRLYEYGVYSSARFALGATVSGITVRLFTYGQGTTGPGFAATSSVSETNMQVGAMAPGNETYEVTSLACEIFGDTNVAVAMADIRLLMRLGVLFWEFGSTTVMCISPIPMIGAGGGIFGFSADTGTPVTQANNGNGGLWAYQNVVVAIPATQAFAVQAQFGTAGQAAALVTVAATQFRVTLFNQARVAIPIA
jgi:hypothetical protein